MDNQFRRVRVRRPAVPTEEFKTPEEVATTDSQPVAAPVINYHATSPENTNINPTMPKKNRWYKKLWPHSKKQWLIFSLIVLLLADGGYWLYGHYKNYPVTKEMIKTVVKPKPSTVASTLTGLQVNPSVNKLPITAIMIENSDAARPQSGLGEAGVVFEAVAEGGVTRFMALYQSNDSTSLGPVRSARPYYVAWALGFDAAYAHVGGSPDALADISSWGVKNMDEFADGSYYQRISSRAAPHNVYTTLSELYKLEQSKGYSSSNFTSWPRKTLKPLAQPTASTINLSLSGPDYNPTFTYSATTNSYSRAEGGSPQTDADTNAVVSPTVVIAIVVPESQGVLDATGAYYSDYSFVGSGTAYIFQDGGVTDGQWTKTSNSAQITFTDSSGNPIDLQPGQVWVTAVSSTGAVSYK